MKCQCPNCKQRYEFTKQYLNSKTVCTCGDEISFRKSCFDDMPYIVSETNEMLNEGSPNAFKFIGITHIVVLCITVFLGLVWITEHKGSVVVYFVYIISSIICICIDFAISSALFHLKKIEWKLKKQ